MLSDLYVPRGSHPQPSGLIPRVIVAGTGAPTDTSGVQPNALYIDLDSGDIYELTDGEWVLRASAGGGGGSGPDVKFSGATNPNGSVTGNVDDIFKSVEALGGDGTVWFKQTGNGTNTGWI